MDAALEVVEGNNNEAENSQGTHFTYHANRVTGPKRRSTVGGWTPELDKLLVDAYDKCEGKTWKKIAQMVPGKNEVQCLHRYQKVLHPSLHKGHWTQDEDNLLSELVAKLGNKRWSEIAKDLPGRIGKQCRERWNNHLKPNINIEPGTKEDDSIIMRAHHENGNKWAYIAKLLPGRTENWIKNRWNCSLKKKLLQWGNPQNLDEKLTSEGYSIMPLHEYKHGNNVKNALISSFGTPYRRAVDLHHIESFKNQNNLLSSDLLQRNKEETGAAPDNFRKDTSHCGPCNLLQLGTTEYFLNPTRITSQCRLAGQELRELDPNPHNFSDRGLHCTSDNLMDSCRNLTEMYPGGRRIVLETLSNQAPSLSSPAKQIELSVSNRSSGPETILRTKATTYKYMPSIIRKRRIEASPQTSPRNKSRKMDESEDKFTCNQPLELEDETDSL